MKISIITINYNNADGLKRTIESVVSQTYNNLEYIIIDGGSTDGSKEVIMSHQEKLFYWVSEPDKGIYNAMNKGIEKATGEYLLFLNSGDTLINEKIIEKVVSLKLDKDLIYGNLLKVKESKIIEWKPDKKLSFSSFYFASIPHPATFINKDLFSLIGLYDEGLKIVSDWKFFFLAICRYNCSYKHIELVISKFIEDGLSSKTENISEILAERNKVLQEDFVFFLHEFEELLVSRKQLRKLRYTIKIKRFLGIR